MPTEEKMVDLDTSGEGAVVNLEEQKDESVVETEAPKKEDVSEEPVETKQEETKEESKKEDEQLEDYSKGVQNRIAKLTRKMREAERREKAAVDYARAVETKRQELESRFKKTDSEYVKKFESSITSSLDSAQRELASAIESGDAAAQTEANKRIAQLAFENAKLEQLKQGREETAKEQPVQLSDGGNLPKETPSQLPSSDPKAESWANENSWFGQDRAMTFTAFEIHKDLVEKEGYDPQTAEYYNEVDKRIRVDFPHRFGNTERQTTSKPVQSVASANRSVKPGRKTVKLTSSQVAIAKKLGVPLEEYAKQLKITKEV